MTNVKDRCIADPINRYHFVNSIHVVFLYGSLQT